MFVLEKMWHEKLKCEVVFVSTGHYPTTAIVKLPSGVTTEVEVIELQPIKEI